MFEGGKLSIDALERVLVEGERLISRIRSQQAEALARLDAAQVTQMDGSRSMIDWTAAKLDVCHGTARQLVQAAKRFCDHPEVAESVAAGEVSFERAMALVGLGDAGADAELVAAAVGWDLAGVRRVTARRRRYSKGDEEQSFRDRFLAMQPSLDDSVVASVGPPTRIRGPCGGEGAPPASRRVPA